MQNHITSSPVSLSYIAALRGVKTRHPGEAFAYTDANCLSTELLTCLAASNPEGKFYGLVATDGMRMEAADAALKRGVTNVAFLALKPKDILAQKVTVLPELDYLCCDESQVLLSAADRQALFDLAEKHLKPNGLFQYTYQAYDQADGHLRFLVREFAPEMNADQAKSFLDDIKKLGGSFLAQNPKTAAELSAAINQNMPDEFFDAFDKGEARSTTFDTMVALRPRGFTYAGDSHIASNYVELSVPPEAQDVIATCRNHILYEPIKDFALNRQVRSDIWCYKPTGQSANLADLFGCFTYGITVPRSEVPSEFRAEGKVIPLTSPLYTSLIDLMTLMPLGIGDFLSHPTGVVFEAKDIVSAIQILVACGIAQPMRGVYASNNVTNVVKPRLVGQFNQYLDKTAVTGAKMWLASPVAGNAMAITARDALVIQALGRAGLANSVSALLPELERLAKNPAQAACVMDATKPTEETARTMIEDVVEKSIVQWYAYGLLEAA